LIILIKNVYNNEQRKLDAGTVISLLHSGYHQSSFLKRISNLLSMMENDLGSYFLMWEHFIKSDAQLFQNNKLIIGDNAYDKIVLTPLLMDFGKNNFNKNFTNFYNIPSQKPIVEQVIDVFNGIKKYLNKDMYFTVVNNKIFDVDFKDTLQTKSEKLFEIYPFLGINPQNYDIKELSVLLNKYFSKYKTIPSNNKENVFFNNMGNFPIDINSDSDFNFQFSGIKLYPPLGFNPLPSNVSEPKAFAKVEYLYNFCIENNIPITTHCSDGGFVTDDKNLELTSPFLWKKVLIKFPKLKLNFAHFGYQDRKLTKNYEWHNQIVNLILTYDNVYTDFSAIATDYSFYQELENVIKESSDPVKLKSHILFGSDFMMVLGSVDSYNEYLNYFSQTNFVNGKNLFCNVNPTNFLYH